LCYDNGIRAIEVLNKSLRICNVEENDRRSKTRTRIRPIRDEKVIKERRMKIG